MTRAITAVGVVGLGTMGAGIAEVFARHGMDVVAVELDPAALERGRGHVERSTGRAVARGKLSADDQQALLARMTFATSLDGLADVDLVVEAVPERLEIKRSLFASLDAICGPATILATNTSSLSVTEIATATTRPDRVIGLHFFNPAPVMKLVEIVHSVLTDADVIADVRALAERLGKTAVSVGDRAGVVTVSASDEAVERAERAAVQLGLTTVRSPLRAGRILAALLLPHLNDAVAMVEEGYASADDIDAAMRFGCGYPVGPIERLDALGLDFVLRGLDAIYAEQREPSLAPAALLRQLVNAGRIGRGEASGLRAPK